MCLAGAYDLLTLDLLCNGFPQPFLIFIMKSFRGKWRCHGMDELPGHISFCLGDPRMSDFLRARRQLILIKQRAA